MALFAAQLIAKIDVRMVITGGILWLAAMTLMRTGWAPTSDYWNLATPHVLQGFGMPFLFIGLTALGIGGVPAKEQVSAAGLMSFLRTLCGAIGTAIATTAWDDASRESRVGIVGTLNDTGGTMGQIQSGGMSVAQSAGMLDRLVEVQASTIGVLHIYWAAAMVFVVAAMVVWIAPRPKVGMGPVAAH